MSDVPKALAWHCPQCLRLTVRLDNQPPPTGCDKCNGDLLRPFPLRARTEKPEGVDE